MTTPVRDRSYFKEQTRLSNEAKSLVGKIKKNNHLTLTMGGEVLIVSRSNADRDYLITSRPIAGAEPRTRRMNKREAISWVKTHLEDGFGNPEFKKDEVA